MIISKTAFAIFVTVWILRGHRKLDKRIVIGREYRKLGEADEKILFFLEKIYDRLEAVQKLKNDTESMKRILLFIAKRELQQQKIQNKNKIWTDEYIKELEDNLNRL